MKAPGTKTRCPLGPFKAPARRKRGSAFYRRCPLCKQKHRAAFALREILHLRGMESSTTEGKESIQTAQPTGSKPEPHSPVKAPAKTPSP